MMNAMIQLVQEKKIICQFSVSPDKDIPLWLGPLAQSLDFIFMELMWDFHLCSMSLTIVTMDNRLDDLLLLSMFFLHLKLDMAISFCQFL